MSSSKAVPYKDGPGSIHREGRAYRAVIWISGRKRSKSFRTKDQAKRWLRERAEEKAQVEAGLCPPAPRFEDSPTYEALRRHLIESWEAGADRVRTERTLAGYRADLNTLLKWWGPKRVVRTTPALIEEYVAHLRGEGAATASIKNRLCRLSQLHRVAVTRGLIAREPCEIRTPRVVAKSQRDAASEAELRDWLDRAAEADGDSGTGRSLTCALLLAADAGLRRAEIVRLMAEDIDLDEGWIHVAVRSEAERTKNARGRNVPILTNRLREALHPILDSEARLVIGATVDSLDKRLRRLPTETRVSLHRLRHRFLSRLAEGGENPVRLQKWAGHADLSVTLRYFHLESDRASVDAESLLDPLSRQRPEDIETERRARKVKSSQI